MKNYAKIMASFLRAKQDGYITEYGVDFETYEVWHEGRRTYGG